MADTMARNATMRRVEARGDRLKGKCGMNQAGD